MKIYVIASAILASTVYLNMPAIDWPPVGAWWQNTKNQVSGLLTRTSHEEQVQQDIPLTTQESICIENIAGAIEIKTEWTKRTVSLDAHKHTTNADDAASITIAVETSDPKILRIKTVCPSQIEHMRVDYTLVVPRGIPLHVITHRGAIAIHELSGAVTATADIGNIHASRISGPVTATITKQGYLAIEDVEGVIQATTKSGSISLQNTRQSVTATTYNGKIVMTADVVPDNSVIRLSSSGNINLSLPADTRAHVQAHCEKGTITTEQTIHLDPVTLKLNESTWRQLRRGITGTIGATATPRARIVLHASSGSIKIVETTKK